ncbi:hypothetical protein IVA91_12570 [Bradyrhizobium sp. 153]|nr:hypothetical protein [Bradyrhizobium sp. 153]
MKAFVPTTFRALSSFFLKADACVKTPDSRRAGHEQVVARDQGPCGPAYFWITPASIRRAGAAVTSITAKIDCIPQTLQDRVKNVEIDSGQ